MVTPPQTQDELLVTLRKMKANGAPKEALQTVYDGFKTRTNAPKPQEAPKESASVLGAAKDFVVGGAKELAGGIAGPFSEGARNLATEGAKQVGEAGQQFGESFKQSNPLTTAAIKATSPLAGEIAPSIFGGEGSAAQDFKKKSDEVKKAEKEYGFASPEAMKAGTEAYLPGLIGTVAAPEKFATAVGEGLGATKKLIEKPIEAVKDLPNKARQLAQDLKPIELETGGTIPFAEAQSTKGLTAQEIADEAARRNPVSEFKPIETPLKKEFPPIEPPTVAPNLEAAQETAIKFRKSLGEAYEAGFDKIVLENSGKKFPAPVSNMKQKAADVAETFGIAKKPISEGKGFNFEGTAFVEPAEETLATRMLNQIESLPQRPTFEQLNTVRKRLSRLNDQAQQKSGELRSFGQQLYNEFRTQIGESVEGIAQLNADFSKGVSIYDDIKNVLTPEKEAQFLNIFKKGKTALRDKIAEFEKVTGSKILGETQAELQSFENAQKGQKILEDSQKSVNKSLMAVQKNTQADITSAQQALQRATKDQLSRAAKDVGMQAKAYNDLLKKVVEQDPVSVRKLLRLVLENPKAAISLTTVLGGGAGAWKWLSSD